MAFKPPLPTETLTRIRARYEPSATRAPCSYQDTAVWADILALLHEIKRMRAMLLRAEQLRERFPQPNGALCEVWEEFLRNLADEPCVRERGMWKEALFEPMEKDKGKTKRPRR
ncbi:hypothetical protein [Bordetella flabilis]|uniref:Uncharacterized protein n=1 Tax=Bordetella flabilis TaxID=463014 RepID=A0A193GHH0_9BORD|nr:hypothetical protein [Bordetella flabilis]ANN78881.1 hypothetical protein BAU07_18715 [Bordetella flabilis]